MGLSWYLSRSTSTFVAANHIAAFFAGTAELLHWLPVGEALVAAIMFIISSLLGLLLITFTPAISPKGFLAILGAGATSLSLSVLTVTAFSGVKDRQFFLHLLSPNLSLFAAPFLSQPSPRVTLECDPIESHSPQKPLRKNVVLILIEALRYDMLKEHREAMPFLTKLAENGTSFSQAFSVSGESTYSSVGIATGMYMLKKEWRDTFLDLSENYRPFYDYIDRNAYKLGYFSSHSEAWQNAERIVKSDALDRFSVVNENLIGDDILQKYSLTENDRRHKSWQILDAQMTDDFLEWVKKIDYSAQFFGRLYFVSSHYPFREPPEQFRRQHVPSIPRELMPSLFVSYPREIIPAMRARYLNSLSYIDFLIERVALGLAAAGRLEDTVFIITGDHGTSFGEDGIFNHAGRITRPGIHVPIILSGIKSPLNANVPVSHIDIAPTILELTGSKIPSRLQGCSLLSCPYQSRPIFSTIQSLADQDAVVYGGSLGVIDTDTGEFRRYPLFGRPDSPTSDECLRELLKDYRLKQLSYYEQSPAMQRECEPPKFVSVAPICRSD
jgi:hypothetical protein